MAVLGGQYVYVDKQLVFENVSVNTDTRTFIRVLDEDGETAIGWTITQRLHMSPRQRSFRVTDADGATLEVTLFSSVAMGCRSCKGS